ncbi:unnamed protein product [Adineta steineri]|uniref:Uncharacterized protein n=1 Tax=Adineta steineri TaxID=433720 RepID=A0A815KJR9_9BILA|nr:unnamed protein product [Adineta steineri]
MNMYCFDTFISLQGLNSIFLIISIIKTISDNTWLNDLQDLSIKPKFESHPFNEGFILLADQTTKSSPTKFKSITSTLYNISSTTCQTKTKQLTTTSSSSTRQTSIQDDSDIGNFLQVDEEELNRELLNMDAVMEGSTTETTVKNVTSCYLIDQCGLCGTNPPRGVCYASDNLSKCRCFVNENDPSMSYAGDFCFTELSEPITSTRSQWTTILIGIFAAIALLFCSITSYLLTLKCLHRRRHSQQQNISNSNRLRIHRSWHLPRAQMPTLLTTENIQNYLKTTLNTSNTNQTNSDHIGSNTIDNIFLKDFNQTMNEKQRVKKSRFVNGTVLPNLLSDTISSQSSYDPIDELDAIIDNSDI